MIKSVFFLLLLGSILSGCHTVRGFGQDVEVTGRSIERASY